MTDFYVTLSSNASARFYPNNTLTHFWNRLPEAIQLEGNEWRVGMVEFQAPINWIQIEPQDGELKVEAFVSVEGVGDDKTLTQLEDTVTIKPGRYKEIKPFVKMLKESFKNSKVKTVKVTFNNLTHTVKITLPSNTFVTVTPRLLAILGITIKETWRADFGKYTLGRWDRKTVYEGRLDLDAGFHTLWVYSNVCAHRMVGDARVPLLRTVPVGSEGKMKYISFQNVHYIPVSQDYFQAIEVFITDTTGHPIPFNAGQVIVTLHFRRSL